MANDCAAGNEKDDCQGEESAEKDGLRRAGSFPLHVEYHQI